jgi:transcriptional regulator of acetoin/glycerol metabolism
MQVLTPLDRARAALESGQRFPEAAVPAAVAESWRRSLAYGLDPRGAPNEAVVAFADVTRRREGARTLRALALAEMQTLHAQIAGSNFMIAFADADGVVLDTLSDLAFANSDAGRNIIPGSVWSERQRGGNALGLALATLAPAAVYGREHFFACHGALSCMAAPIVDPGGRLVGLIDASCANEARQQHTHALVKMAAVQVENGLMFRDLREQFILAFHPRAEFLDTLSAGLLAASADGEILSVNRAGAALLAGLPARKGAAFTNLFERRFGEALDEMLSGRVARIRDRAGSGVFMVCRQIARKVRRIGPVAPKPVGFVSADPRVAASLVDLEGALRLAMPVHIYGETGVGKELMARRAHETSGRKGAFVAINCGALPEDLFVAELFGHERGAFTSARAEGSPGLARQADGGTLFLDEVGDVPLAAQTTLLRFLDNGEARAIGAAACKRLDVQIVSATNRRLSGLVEARQFRLDLLHRLEAFVIELPPLRVRTDFADIVRAALAELAPGAAITDTGVAELARRRWAGNIRELRHVLQRALIRRGATRLDEQAFVDGEPAHACPACQESPLDRRFCEEIETTHRACAGNVAQTARRLGLSRTTVYKHLSRAGS